MMKTAIISIILTLCLPLTVMAQDDALRFDASKGERQSLTMPNGKVVDYIAWEGITYVTNVEDPKYQTLNYYVPVAVAERTDMPILLRNNVGGYKAAPAGHPSATDATGRALSEGYAVCIPGARGSNSTVENADGATVYTGRAPAGLVDLKAAVRYLRHNKGIIPGDVEKIISDGTSAGGAMSSLLGATGNHPVYEPYLTAMGAAKERDDIFAAVCYCPITDLDHADMAYEWLFSCTNDGVRHLTDEQKAVSEQLAAAFPAYLNSLQLRTEDGTLLTDANYLDYVKSFLIASAQHALDETCQIPDSIGVVMFSGGQRGPRGEGGPGEGGPGRGGRGQGGPGGGPNGGPGGRPGGRSSGYVSDIDMPLYLSYLASTTRLKSPPAFDAMGVLSPNDTPENQVFGDSEGSSANFTEFSLRKATGQADTTLPQPLQERVWMMNPMNFIGNSEATTSRHWYIRHGASDRDTSFPVPVNLATKLRNCGYEVNFALPWNRPHSGDYNLNDLFLWISSITK